MSEELQHIKEQAKQLQVEATEAQNYTLPRLLISEEDKDLYIQCLATGKPFYQEMKNEEYKLDLIFRDKTKKEGDIVSRQIDMLMQSGQILSAAEANSLFNLGCLYYQLQSINGVPQIREYPESVWNMKDFSLPAVIEKSFLGQASSTYIFVVVCMMSQFNNKLLDLSRRVLDPSFSYPAKDS